MAQATLGGGCFWCLEGLYQTLAGVSKIVSGYAGGHTLNPTYPAICEGNTGHAEVVQISYDPHVLSYQQLLLFFFSIHDPTTLNRQGYDVGTQYRSIIFYTTHEQEHEAHAIIQELDKTKHWSSPIVTTVEPFTVFYPAELEHQNFYKNNPNHPYCQRIIKPKLDKVYK
jgi:peptide-methionine (S)-S-oxide reductase